LILVTAISPTPAGEGKTTTSVGLGDALNKIGKNALVTIREPSLGPVFGMKGGAAGGGLAQVIPMEDINLHFTGDFNAIQLANNLLAAMLDNHIHHGNALKIDVRRVSWKRVLDMNDRALRKTVCSLGSIGNGYPREDGFDIVVAEGQSIGTPLSFGGPTVGWFATKKEFARLVPGRIIGESRDTNNMKTYVMTLRAREQDIRREKASSNICTNQTLNAIGSAIHLCWLGPEGIYAMGYQAMQKANYLKNKLQKEKIEILNHKSSIREFIIKTSKNTDVVIEGMADEGFLAGIKYDDNHLLIAVTEKRTKKELDKYVDSLKKVLK